MTWAERWETRDPMLVLERKQEREARSKRGKAKAGLQALFEGEVMTQDESGRSEKQVNTVETYSDKC